MPSALAADSACAAARETKPGSQASSGDPWRGCSHTVESVRMLGLSRKRRLLPPPWDTVGGSALVLLRSAPAGSLQIKTKQTKTWDKVYTKRKKCRVTGKSARTRSHLRSDNRIPLQTRGNSPGKPARAPEATLPSHGRDHLRGAQPGLNSGLRDVPTAPLTGDGPGQPPNSA